jgi:hypothetical protein
MGLETATYIPSLVTSNPDGGDQRSTADDHIRLLKSVLRRTFPLLDGAVSLSSVQYAFLLDVTKSVQAQINSLRDGSATANNALFANSASFAASANHAVSCSEATLALTANSASYAALAGQAASASFATLAATANSASYAALAGQANSASFATIARTANSASFAVLAGTAALATNATDALSAATAGNLQGFAPNTSATANTVVVRDASGDVYARFFNTLATQANGTLTDVLTRQTGGNFVRPTSLANLGSQIEAQNISGRTGTRKTLTAGTSVSATSTTSK